MDNNRSYSPGLRASLLKRFETVTVGAGFNIHTEEFLGSSRKSEVKTILDSFERVRDELRSRDVVPIELQFSDEDGALRFIQNIHDREKRQGQNEFSYLDAYEMKIVNTIFGNGLDLSEEMPPTVTITTGRNTDWIDFTGEFAEWLANPNPDIRPETPVATFLRETYGVTGFYFKFIECAPAPTHQHNSSEPKICPA